MLEKYVFFKETVIFFSFTYTKYPIKARVTYFVNKWPPYCRENVQEQKLSDIISMISIIL